MSADILLQQLQKVKQTKPGCWIACCPAHDDKSPSLSIRETDSGAILLHCFSGCSVDEIVHAVGLQLHDLFPPRPDDAQFKKGERRPFLPSDVFDIARREIGVVAILACDLHKNKAVSEDDYERIFIAVQRLNDVARAAYGK